MLKYSLKKWLLRDSLYIKLGKKYIEWMTMMTVFQIQMNKNKVNKKNLKKVNQKEVVITNLNLRNLFKEHSKFTI